MVWDWKLRGTTPQIPNSMNSAFMCLRQWEIHRNVLARLMIDGEARPEIMKRIEFLRARITALEESSD